uniref:Uncharacterized protein n=1 Tax=Vombatus ursinus TaxID=29139 RepID=A0A4X2KHQ9_VOMUR
KIPLTPCTISHWLRDQINLLNYLGFALCLSGLSLHNPLKTFLSKGKSDPKSHEGPITSPDLESFRNYFYGKGNLVARKVGEEYFGAQGQ